MTVFDDARTEWNSLITKTSWASPVFGDTYYIRYPIESGTAEAITYKQSIYKGDDSVHAWDARGVRQKIIQRIIKSQARTIRPWYGELSFFADQIKLLPPLPESELDFILRTSLQSKIEAEELQKFPEARKELLKHLDPDLTEDKEERKTFFQITRPEDRAKKYSRAQIELYGLLNVIKDQIIIGAFSDEEIKQIIDMLLDIDQSDNFLVKRFIEPNMPEEDMRPFIGQNNPEVKLKLNFLEKFIAGGDRDFYKFRVSQLWLRNLLDFDKQAANYIESIRSDILKVFRNEEITKSLIFQAIQLYKWEAHKERVYSKLKTEYASKLDFKGYASDVIHLINNQRKLFSELSPELLSLTIDPSNYDPKKICHEIGVEMIESVLVYLANQIPEPEGHSKSQTRLVMNKRISNMKKYVLSDDIRESILETTSRLYELIDLENEKAIEDVIREPHQRLVPRGEHYFEEMKTEVETMMIEMGDQDLRKELAASTDDPQTLVKQYGNVALGMVGREAELDELYSTILGLKSTEVIFSGSAELTPMRKRKITQSLIDDFFSPQLKFLELLSKEEMEE
ncbi:MAG: hypothetical protein ACFE95_20475 [Candidatus Hodarchaeota archaeon]